MIKIHNQYKTIDRYKNEITQDKLIIIHINIRGLLWNIKTGQITHKKRGGGVCIYIHKSIEYKLINDLTFNITDYLEILSIEIKLNLSNKLLLSTLYNSSFHRQSDFLNTLQRYYDPSDDLCTLYEKCHTHINDNIILLGDFNNETNTSTIPLNLLTTQLGLKPTITQTTRPIHNTSANTIINQIYINPNYHPRIKKISNILLEDITDHLPIYI